MASFKDFVKQRKQNAPAAAAAAPRAVPARAAAAPAPGTAAAPDVLRWTPHPFEPMFEVPAPAAARPAAPRSHALPFFDAEAEAARDRGAARWRCLHARCACDRWRCGGVPAGAARDAWWRRPCAGCGHGRECHVSDAPLAATARAPGGRPRVLLVCHEVYFADAKCDGGADAAKTADFGNVPTGALFVSWALILFLAERADLTILAVSRKPRENPGLSDFGGLYLGRIPADSAPS